MSIEITDPRLLAFLEEQVRLGRYANANEAIEALIARWMLEQDAEPLDEETLRAIDDTEAQIEQGECLPLETARAQLEAKWASRRGNG